jgi:acyl-CoA thioester hydrolase
MGNCGMNDPAFILHARVYYEDTDAGGVVYYANYLRFFERARTELLRQAGAGRALLQAQDELGFVVRRVEADYLAPARLDDALEIHASIERLGGASADFIQAVVCQGRVLCQARIAVVCVSFSSMKAQRMPQHLVTALQPYVRAYSHPSEKI